MPHHELRQGRARPMGRGAAARVLPLALTLLLAACGPKFQPVPAPSPDVLGTWVGTWGGVPTTLVIQGYESAPPAGGLVVGTVSIDGLLGAPSQMTVSGTITHPSPEGPRASTFTARVGYVAGQLVLLLSLPTLDSLQNFEELSLAVEKDTLVGEAVRDYPEGPKGPIRLVRQLPRKP